MSPKTQCVRIWDCACTFALYLCLYLDVHVHSRNSRTRLKFLHILLLGTFYYFLQTSSGWILHCLPIIKYHLKNVKHSTKSVLHSYKSKQCLVQNILCCGLYWLILAAKSHDRKSVNLSVKPVWHKFKLKQCHIRNILCCSSYVYCLRNLMKLNLMTVNCSVKSVWHKC